MCNVDRLAKPYPSLTNIIKSEKDISREAELTRTPPTPPSSKNLFAYTKHIASVPLRIQETMERKEDRSSSKNLTLSAVESQTLTNGGWGGRQNSKNVKRTIIEFLLIISSEGRTRY